MKFHIPFTIANFKILKKKSNFFLQKIKHKESSRLVENLKNGDVDITREEYIAICLRSFFISLVILYVVFTTVLAILGVKLFYLFGLLVSLLFSCFVFFSQMSYPQVYIFKKQRAIEKNLIPALQDIHVQLNSGIPLFNVLVNISDADYGELSSEFKKAVRRLNAGEPESEVLDDLGRRNPSIFFRRTLWQISNGMRAGSDMIVVIEDSIKSLTEEQLIQVQNYGNKLNPLVVFYMLISVIIPALSITFLTIISSMVNLERNMVMVSFIGLLVFIILVQIMFLGMIKSKRPSLL